LNKDLTVDVDPTIDIYTKMNSVDLLNKAIIRSLNEVFEDFGIDPIGDVTKLTLELSTENLPTLTTTKYLIEGK
jgi:hypothetical protein